MAGPASLITLASGRLTPLSRLALGLGLGLFLAVILLVRPVHVPAPRLAPERAGVLALEAGSAWVDRAMLEDGAGLFMPATFEGARGSDATQPDAAPFPSFGPELRHDPAKPLAVDSLDGSMGKWATLEETFAPMDRSPYLTLGQKPRRPSTQSLPSRYLQISAFSDINEQVFKHDIRSDEEWLRNHKSLTDNKIKVFSAVELRLGIDQMGLQSKPYLLRSSGDVLWDQALLDLAQKLPWTTWLKPGSYRVVIGP